MLQISEIVKKTEEMFDLFNEHFYESELNRPAITVSPDGGRGAYGWCSINEIWNASGSAQGSVKNFVALVKNSSFLVRITDMTILIEKEFIYGSSKRPNPTDYYRKQHYQCG